MPTVRSHHHNWLLVFSLKSVANVHIPSEERQDSQISFNFYSTMKVHLMKSHPPLTHDIPRSLHIFFLNLSLYFTIIIMNRMITRTNTSYDYDIDTTYDNPRCSSIMYILYCIRKNLNLISCICLHRGSDDFLSSFCAHMNRMAVCDQYENNFFPRRYGFGGVFAR